MRESPCHGVANLHGGTKSPDDLLVTPIDTDAPPLAGPRTPLSIGPINVCPRGLIVGDVSRNG
jgi:hypothetical protein